MAKKYKPIDEGFCGIISDDAIKFYWCGEKVVTESYGLYQSIFSRNKGILESDVMKKKCAVIIGCGSVGSLVAMELARAGVEKFVLCDADTLEYHNVCRHQCGIEDVGIFSYPLQVTTSLVVKYGKECDGKCNFELEEK